jgi:hypothetical protein
MSPHWDRSPAPIFGTPVSLAYGICPVRRPPAVVDEQRPPCPGNDESAGPPGEESQLAIPDRKNGLDRLDPGPIHLMLVGAHAVTVRGGAARGFLAVLIPRDR